MSEHYAEMADPGLIEGHVCQKCGVAGDNYEVHIPVRCTSARGCHARWHSATCPTFHGSERGA